jgi:hypothetical protein
VVPAEHAPALEGADDAHRGTAARHDRHHRFLEKTHRGEKLRGSLDIEILGSGIPALTDKHERIAVEIVKLAEKRHDDLLA